MADDTIAYDWSKNTSRMYRYMIVRHRPLWRYVRAYIEEHKVQSVFEVGCGMHSPASKLSLDWTGVDLNPNAPAIHEDFFEMDLTPWKGIDVFLAGAVIEHCNGIRPFLSKMKEIQAKVYMVSFFRGLRRDCTYMQRGGRGYWLNKYSGREVRETAESLGLTCDLVRFSHRSYLAIMEDDSA